VTEPRYWRNRRWNGPNQPVVGVSFWEAEACSTWAGGRLPREEEWEAAARGRESSAYPTYPWGNDWRNGICNTAEAGLGVTSPVGLFPHGRQAQLGIEDLAGNVWEWCESLFHYLQFPLSAKSESEFLNTVMLPDPTLRVVRGGSWSGGRDHPGVRHSGYSYSRYDNFGFRVVCSSPSSVTDR
jgi:formylglycine-generating enzyme required for sulfatase activity